MSRVIVITPWKGGQDELLVPYAALVSKADIVYAIDNDEHDDWPDGFSVIRANPPLSFSKSNNLIARAPGVDVDDTIVFLNSDTAGDPSWVETARIQVQPGYLYGQSLVSTAGVVCPISREPARIEDGDVVFLEGWCLAATAGTWERIRWWPEWDGFYWEDVLVSLNAQRAGVPLRHVQWGIEHRVGQTSRTRPGGEIIRQFWKSRNRFLEAL